MMWWKDFKIF